MFSRVGPAAFKKDLSNTESLCTFIGHPEKKFKSIHVAGTNGKGSVCHFLASIFQEAGYRTGLYTSPHIHDFRERIRVNGIMVEPSFVIDFVESTMAITDKINPSFFELTVAMAFSYFAKSEVDIAIIETGLGGRLDSTNVILPELSVITNISYDHMNMLGNTLEQIAFEKAGIIKQGIPVVVGNHQQETDHVFIETAKKKKSSLLFSTDHFRFEEQHGDQFVFKDISSNKELRIQSGLTGVYQQQNISTVLMAVYEMRSQGWNISGKQVGNGFRKVVDLTGIEARWQKISSLPDIILDVAHNEDGILQILKQLESSFSKSQLHFVIGFVNDKPLEKVLSHLPVAATYYFTQAHIPRALPSEMLQQQAASFQLSGKSYPDVNDAIRAAVGQAGPSDVILVCGSFFIISEVDAETIISCANYSGK